MRHISFLNVINIFEHETSSKCVEWCAISDFAKNQFHQKDAIRRIQLNCTDTATCEILLACTKVGDHLSASIGNFSTTVNIKIPLSNFKLHTLVIFFQINHILFKNQKLQYEIIGTITAHTYYNI